MIRVKVATDGGILTVISARAPQQGCEHAGMDRFTDNLEDLVRRTPKEQELVLEDDKLLHYLNS